MAKGYWIAHVTVHDPEGYKKYQAANAAAFTKYGARFLVRAGQAKVVAGALKARHVILEFDSYEKALACYESPEYQAAIVARGTSADVDLVVVEGYEG